MAQYKLLKDSPPFLTAGTLYDMDLETAQVTWYDEYDKTWSEYPLRPGLAGWLWLLRTEDGWMKRID